MGRTHQKMLIGIIGVFLIALLTNNATITVADGNWGNLRVGNRIAWRNWPLDEPPPDPGDGAYYEITVTDISDPDIQYEYRQGYINSGTLTITDTGKYTEDYVIHVSGFWGAFSRKSLRVMQAGAASEPDLEWSEVKHDWNGITCETYYFTSTLDGTFIEVWIDQDTGIILEYQRTTGGTTITVTELLETTASLTEAGVCLGSILIACVSVVTLVSYSLVQYRKRNKRNF